MFIYLRIIFLCCLCHTVVYGVGIADEEQLGNHVKELNSQLTQIIPLSEILKQKILQLNQDTKVAELTVDMLLNDFDTSKAYLGSLITILGDTHNILSDIILDGGDIDNALVNRLTTLIRSLEAGIEALTGYHRVPSGIRYCTHVTRRVNSNHTQSTGAISCCRELNSDGTCPSRLH